MKLRRRALLALAIAVVPSVATAAADGPLPAGSTTEGIPQTWSNPTIYPVVDLPVSFNTPMTLPASAGVPTVPVPAGTDAVAQSNPPVCVDGLCPDISEVVKGGAGGTGSSSLTVTVGLSSSRTLYSTGEAVGFQVTVTTSSNVVVSSVSNPIPTGFQPMPAGAITMDGAPCNAGTSPACTVTSQGLQVSSYSGKPNQSHVFAFAMVADWTPRGCGLLTDQALATSSGGTSTGSQGTDVCDGGLGLEPWWSYVTRSTGPQGAASMNVASGNLVAVQDDGTAIPGHGRVVLQPHRVYNSEDSGNAPAPNAFGTNWVVDFDQWSGSPPGATAVGALYVPPAESVAADHAVTIVDDGGSRQVVPLQLLSSPVNVTGLQAAGDTTPWSVLVPRVLQLDTASYDHICVDAVSAQTAGVHLGMWRYTEVKAAGSSTPCTPASGTTPVVLGWGAERPDRVRYEFAWNGAKLDAEDGNANEVRYAYTSAPAVGASLGASTLVSVTEVASGRHFSISRPSSTETDVTDPAGRIAKYTFASSGGLLTGVANPDGHGIAYTYGAACSGATAAQLCGITDPNGHTTSFAYTATWSDGTGVTGPPKLASITDRTGAVTTMTHVHSPDYVTADLGSKRTRYLSFDPAGSVGEVDGIDISNVSSPLTLHQTLEFWDTASGASPCTQPDAFSDHDLCRTFREALNGKATAADTSFTYNMAGEPLVERRCLASSDSSSPPPCPVSTTASVTSRDTTWGYRALYVEASGTNATYTDTPQGGGTVSSTTPTASTRWDGQTLYALYDLTETLDARGNAPGLSSSQVQPYVQAITVDNQSTVAPNRAVSAGSCPTVATNTGNLCATSGPGTASFQYAYDRYGQRTSVATSKILAEGGQHFTYSYFPDSATDLSGTTSAGGWLQAATDPYGHFTAYGYDAAGNVARTWDPDATNGLQPSAFPGTLTAPPNTAFVEVLHSNGSTPYATPWRYVWSTTDQLGDTTSYTLDSNGNRLTIRPPRGNAAGNGSYDTTQTFSARDELLTRLPPVEAASNTSTNPTSWRYGYDAAGNRTSTTDPTGVVTVDAYDAVNRHVTTQYTLAASGAESTPPSCRISTSGDAPIPANKILCTRSQSYDGVDNVTSSADGNGQVTTFSFDGVHDELSRNVPRNDGTYTTLRTDHVYDLDGNVTAICPPRTFADGGATSCTDPVLAVPYRVQQSWDPQNHLVSTSTVSAPPGSTSGQTNTYSYQYDADGNRTGVTDPDNHTQTSTYDLLDRRTALTVPRDASTSVTTSDAYDPASRLLSETVGSHATAYAYDAAGRMTDEVSGWDGTSAVASAVASSDGGTNAHSRRVYDRDGNVVQAYDPRAFAGSSTDSRSFMLTAVYDADGRQTDQYLPRWDSGSYSDLSSGSTDQNHQCPTGNGPGYPSTVGVCHQSLAYDYRGDVTQYTAVTSIVAGAGSRSVTYTVSDDGRILSASTASPSGGGSAVEQYEYDAEGRVVKDTDPMLRPTTVAYTSDGLQQTVTAEPNGATNHITNYAYNADGRVTSTVDPAGLKTTNTYYSDDRLSSVTDNAGDATTYAYDGSGNPVQVFSPSATAKVAPDASGTPTANTYTFDNLLLTTTRPVASDGSSLRRVTYSYADFGGKASQDTAYVNASGSVVGDSGAQHFSYYPDERLQTETGRTGATITHRYDAAGNETSAGAGGQAITATYYLDGHLRSITDADASAVSGAANSALSYGYDGAGGISSEVDSLSTGGQYTMSYGYAGNSETVTSMTSSLAGNWSWSYDNDGEVTHENDPNTDYVDYNWNADGTLAQRSYSRTTGNMSQWQYIYDSDYRQVNRYYHGVTANNGGTTLYTNYTYDNAGRLSKFSRTDLSGNWTVPDKTATWDRDGNRLSWGDGSSANTVTATYNADDSIATSTSAGTTYSYTYDYAGRLGTDQCRGYVYDGFDELTQVSSRNNSNCGRVESATYGYDALGRRNVVADGPYGESTAVHFRGLSNSVVAEQQMTGHSYNVVYTLGTKGDVLADTFGPLTFDHTEYLSQDGYASITNALSASGAMACDAFADPFGVPFAGSGSNPCHTGSMNDTLLYRQAQRDATSGQYQMGARSYDPAKGSFAQPDSYRINGSDLSLITNPLTANPYAYAGGDPVNFSDPTGHDICRENPQDCVDDTGAADQGLMNAQAAGTKGASAAQVQQAEANGRAHQARAERMRKTAALTLPTADPGTQVAVLTALGQLAGINVGSECANDQWAAVMGGQCASADEIGALSGLAEDFASMCAEMSFDQPGCVNALNAEVETQQSAALSKSDQQCVRDGWAPGCDNSSPSLARIEGGGLLGLIIGLSQGGGGAEVDPLLSSAVDLVGQGDSAALAFPGGLAANDALSGGGHVLSHVGLSDADLAARGLTAASTFKDRATAESALADLQDVNSSEIAAWLRSANSGATKAFAATFDDAIGRVLYAGAQSSVPGSTAIGVLRAAPGSLLGYYIWTGYIAP